MRLATVIMSPSSQTMKRPFLRKETIYLAWEEKHDICKYESKVQVLSTFLLLCLFSVSTEAQGDTSLYSCLRRYPPLRKGTTQHLTIRLRIRIHSPQDNYLIHSFLQQISTEWLLSARHCPRHCWERSISGQTMPHDTFEKIRWRPGRFFCHPLQPDPSRQVKNLQREGRSSVDNYLDIVWQWILREEKESETYFCFLEFHLIAIKDESKVRLREERSP